MPAPWSVAGSGGPPPLPRTFWLLWTGQLLNRLGSAVEPFLALFLTGTRGVGTAQAGLVLTSLGLGSAVGQPLGGVLADRVGRRPTLLLAFGGQVAALALVWAARGLVGLAVAVGVYGLLLDLARPAFQAAVADVVAPDQRPRAYALLFWAVNLGFAVAVPAAGALAARGWWLLFAVDAAGCLAVAVLVALRLPETRPAAVPGSPPGRLAEVLRDRLLLALVVAVSVQATVYLQAFLTLPLVMRRDGLGASAYGLALGVNAALIVVLQPLVLRLVAARDRGRLLLAAGVLQAGGVALHGLASTLPGHAAVVVVWTLGEVLQAGLLGSVAASLAPAHLRGRYLGAFGAAFGIAALVAPLAGTQLLARLGEPALWGSCAVAGTLSAVALRRVSDAAAVRAADQTPTALNPPST